jgi:SNF2 family DNA or RNA helicase
LFQRGDLVPDDFWFPVALRLGAQCAATATEFVVPVQGLLSGRQWLGEHCRRYGVGIEFDELVRALLRTAQHESTFLRKLQDGEPGPGFPQAKRTSEPDARTRLTRELRDFQERDLKKLLDLPNGANFSVPGAGKTTVCYALYEAERLRGRVAQLLVVAPISAFESWETEAVICFDPAPIVRRFDGAVPWDAEVVLVNYQKLREPYVERLAEWALRTPTHIVLDEAHRMKRGHQGEWGRACLQLAHVAARRDLLTGTPAPQSPRDFVALLEYLWPGQGISLMPPTALHAEPPPGAMELVNKVLDPLYVRTTKRELGLRDPELRVERLSLGPIQSQIYDALRNRYAGMFDLSKDDRLLFAQMGEVSMYLLEAASNPTLLSRNKGERRPSALRYPSLSIPAGSRLSDLVESYSEFELPPKLQRLVALVDENAILGRKTLVWSNFVGNLLAIELLLANYNPALVYGGIPSIDGDAPEGVRTREREMRRFRREPECMVLLANPAAMAEGVSLHDVCHDAMYVDRTFNAGQYLQSLDRIHRLGLPPETETRITFFISDGTIDERVNERVALKASRLSQMLNDEDLVTMALPDEEDYGMPMEDVADLTALLKHLRRDDD